MSTPTTLVAPLEVRQREHEPVDWDSRGRWDSSNEEWQAVCRCGYRSGWYAAGIWVARLDVWRHANLAGIQQRIPVQRTDFYDRPDPETEEPLPAGVGGFRPDASELEALMAAVVSHGR